MEPKDSPPPVTPIPSTLEALPMETPDVVGGSEVMPRNRGGLARGVDPLDPELELSEFEAIFQYAPLAMVLVDRARVVRRMNRAAVRLAGVLPEAAPGQLPGVVLCCSSLDDDAGCGKGPRCPGCSLRRLIEHTFESKRRVRSAETSTPYASGGRVEERRLRIATSYMTIRDEERTLLCIEDITDLQALQERAVKVLEPAR